ncbi:hypothetical protein VNO77_03676 [Canavalia gladiata]|uniref:Uncharacterized protein n=1 Tax=Canavalia gladiata TaxID=3824 RepID=A0AAN9MVZ2_CANGL
MVNEIQREKRLRTFKKSSERGKEKREEKLDTSLEIGEGELGKGSFFYSLAGAASQNLENKEDRCYKPRPAPYEEDISQACDSHAIKVSFLSPLLLDYCWFMNLGHFAFEMCSVITYKQNRIISCST